MSKKLSRRTLLKTGLFAAASAPSAALLSKSWFAHTHALPEDLPADKPLVKLNSNENPYGPSAKAREAVIEAVSSANRYPRSAIRKLQKKIAAFEGLDPDQILISAGSTELLGICGLMYGLKKGKVMGCHPTFDFMLYFASQFGAEWIKVPMTEDHRYNLNGLNTRMDSSVDLVFICNPNNPSGTDLPLARLKPFCEVLSQRVPVYVDEAYIEFTDGGLRNSLAHLTTDNKNLIIGRTFSKVYGLAGLRVGYAIAHPHTISALKKHMATRTVGPSVCSVAAATASLGDREFVDHCVRMNARAMDMVTSRFDEWGVDYLPSTTSFLLFKTEAFRPDLQSALQKQNVLIRAYSHIPGWARVSMGTPDEMTSFLAQAEKNLG